MKDFSSAAAIAVDTTEQWRLRRNDASAMLTRTLGAHRCDRAAGQVIEFEGDETLAVYCVLSGWIAVTKSTEDGHRMIVDLVLPGEQIDPASADAGTSSVQIEALTDVTIAAVPDPVFQRLTRAHPEIRARFDRNVAAAMARMSERMLRLGKSKAEGRIAYALCELCLRAGEGRFADGAVFRIPMTQQQLGDFTGLSSVHVCRTLRRLQAKGIVTAVEHMEVTIRDAARLARLAEVDPEALRNEILPAA
jgi:CRP-like cAMP-binding protein